ncbi:hypothetical protein GLOIN_2v1715032 [Rhizophagus irregularis DAOM 181602=DAOM 197198]|uniref:Uncharacterized protein n=1 Tax=Rhizophagus irregularis (strain DAOM 181602 / DAOM 197198 / MUCL 43194) TaxID=747089 RepID=A0A2P4P4F2_RHIID|nr:hypothetical protein GLOIN_2v1715032 [Rhizophagus irregularis DAOM 181602=DAOM 197198]POG60263.1 hypothetical protein GLOIN_2v1715032 [Rhizophagus irregularis DAOM 181602=DAOM 197198]|eukprot:XP_025167129.1 hypothetical protein GLOIN_2v1715032 [Rhizophagus irregularis DAOM 181602=DAOM 197198]
MVALEGEINVISTSSGWTVQFVAISTIRSVGDNIISTSCLYEEFAKLINNKPKAIYLESMRNTKFNIPDFEAIFIAENTCEYFIKSI